MPTYTQAKPITAFLEQATRFLFFTGKGGVGKTSLACATAVALADKGKSVLLVSTDPASNLDEVLATELSNQPTPVRGLEGKLDALNIDPESAARDYRERIVGPIRGVLPDATVRNIEEQLSGACTTEIASFNEFSSLLGKPESVTSYEYVILDTAPTGHTLRLLALPAAWSEFIAENKSGSTCLGPLSGLADQREVYEKALAALRDASQTTLALVARADTSSLREADRAQKELSELGIKNQALLLNAVFHSSETFDPMSQAFAKRCQDALRDIPATLSALPQFEAPYRVSGLTGLDRLRSLYSDTDDDVVRTNIEIHSEAHPSLDELIDDIASSERGVIMTMGKGGVGKTSLAKRIALELAKRGKRTLLTTTDPANHVEDLQSEDCLTVSSIDPKQVTRQHVETVLATTGKDLDTAARELLEEELRSPCTEEIAVFTAFALEVAKGEEQFVVLDTAPTGHTLLLLDATEAYHREVLKNAAALPESVQHLLPRLRNPKFTKTLIVTLPEATPVHEAAQLQKDLRRAGIEPHAWIVNQCIDTNATQDPKLLAKGAFEHNFIREVATQHATRYAINHWSPTA
ncbi:arsenical pump-driving ATPase [Pelagicoccus sp. SDUM812002]|uniref:arsenical pump-driving ATPase n=1 Tax=Pelagicoccus sp. SDUM812002 TaxID=3041266 RepID=UPI00280EBA85|nr:arsenical pump-driving ATPase [Pelagicoccus sp. SDUM812002]MDQ8188311.1 arsenical pump-driving ATPase [Pelagicoccus sp. SDUM812002]